MIQKPSKSRTKQPLHVLVAEDGLVNQRLAQGLLTREGHRVTFAHNGARRCRNSVERGTTWY